MTEITKTKPPMKRTRKIANEPKAEAASASPKSAAAADPFDQTPVRSPTKASIVEHLLMRADGASLDELCEATGWLPHTCRAFLTGLRKKGRILDRRKRDDGTTIYKLGSGAPVDAGEAREAAETAS